MKQVRLSRAFGATPKSVYRCMEKALSTAAKTLETDESRKQKADFYLYQPAVHKRGIGLILLAAALLIATAWLMLDPFQHTDVTEKIYGNVQLMEAQLRIYEATATTQKVQAAVSIHVPKYASIHYFHYDDQTLPQQFPSAGQVAYYVFCALSWEEANRFAFSDMVNTQPYGSDGLSLRLSGTWQAEKGIHPLQCVVTVVRVQADGSYQPGDVQKTVIPMTVEVK